MEQNQQFMTAMKKDFEVMLNQRLDQLRHPQHISDDDCYRLRPMGDDDDQDDGRRAATTETFHVIFSLPSFCRRHRNPIRRNLAALFLPLRSSLD
ncbi:hypothetical protein Cni_G14193 [Canna indica]|uniref:Uncharacterized protein n=1 Tax=Canna indica TaxID=4628 RepID=A0AAQ3KCH6_9LILI|nr:hypothetical protein Cni_G14193 [Canna indica]